MSELENGFEEGHSIISECLFALTYTAYQSTYPRKISLAEPWDLCPKKKDHIGHINCKKIPLSELCTCEPDFGGMYWMGSSITLPAGPGNFVWNTPAKRHATALLEQCL